MKSRLLKTLSCLLLMLCMTLAVSAQGVGTVSGPKKKKQTTTTTTTTTRQSSGSSNAKSDAAAKEQAKQKAAQEAREKAAREERERKEKAEREASEEQARKEKAEQEARFNSLLYNASTNTITYRDYSYKMVYVSGSTFTMGATKEQGLDAWDNEKPAHSVTLSNYYIGQTEVPQWLWTAVMGKNPSNWQGDTLPVEKVSWNDCQTFISKLNALTGMTFCLPTEAQWEYAARGGSGSRGYKYSGDNSLDDVAWLKDNSDNKTHDVGTKAANELGLYDMSGNVWEWCSDWKYSYSSSSQTDPKGADSGSDRVIRGGSWYSNARLCRVSRRNYYPPSKSFNYLGLRLALGS